jgi:hypothetical protein
MHVFSTPKRLATKTAHFHINEEELLNKSIKTQKNNKNIKNHIKPNKKPKF